MAIPRNEPSRLNRVVSAPIVLSQAQWSAHPCRPPRNAWESGTGTGRGGDGQNCSKSSSGGAGGGAGAGGLGARISSRIRRSSRLGGHGGGRGDDEGIEGCRGDGSGCLCTCLTCWCLHASTGSSSSLPSEAWSVLVMMARLPSSLSSSSPTARRSLQERRAWRSFRGVGGTKPTATTFASKRDLTIQTTSSPSCQSPGSAWTSHLPCASPAII
mmetsp:Transcript_53607/g.138584  ORF Transcript_53607/g.138584 Transcript_53607/m.138584 type:complete len:214 (+) Transcript_53607:180-821(+)